MFLSILFSTVADRIGGAFRAAAGAPAFQVAPADPAVLAEQANRAPTEAEPAAVAIVQVASVAASPAARMPTAAALLAGVPLFAGLPAQALRTVVRAAVPSCLPAGGRLFEQGDPGDTLYVVRSGRVEAVADGKLVRVFGPGEAFGELALLSGGVRTASVRARRDSELLALRRSDFDRLLATEPAFARALVGQLAARVPSSDAPASSAAAGAVLALVPAHAAVPPQTMRHLAGLVEYHLARLGHVTRLDVDGEPSRWARRLDAAEAAHDRVLLVATRPGDSWARFCLREADRPLAVVDPSQDPPVDSCLPSGCQLVALAHAGLGRWLDALAPSAHHLVDLAAPEPDIGRLARRVSGRSLGIVLSGGGARGLAHVGVIEVLQRAGAQIDRVGGTSMGAVVAGLVALGCGAEEMLDVARRELVTKRPFTDYAWPRHALIRGARAQATLDRVFGPAMIEDQRCGMFAVSVDLLAAEEVVHRRGRIADAVALSVLLPGIAPPRRVGDRLHVDGGVLNNLPIDVMAADGEGPVLACDVEPSFGAVLGGTGSARLPGIIDTLSRSMTLARSRRAATDRALAHTVITPDLGGIGMFDFKQIDELVDRGRRAAEEALAGLGDVLP